MGDSGFDGRGGQYFEIAGNTFLATNRRNFDLRGTSCQPVDFRGNVSLQSLDDAIGCTDCGGGIIDVAGGGSGSGTVVHATVPPSGVPAIGAFDATPGADLLLWNLDAIPDPANGIGPPPAVGQATSSFQWPLISSSGTGLLAALRHQQHALNRESPGTPPSARGAAQRVFHVTYTWRVDRLYGSRCTKVGWCADF